MILILTERQPWQPVNCGWIKTSTEIATLAGIWRIRSPVRQLAGHVVKAVWIARNKMAYREKRQEQGVPACFPAELEDKAGVDDVSDEAFEILLFVSRILCFRSDLQSRIWIPRSERRSALVLTPSSGRRPGPERWQESSIKQI